MTTSGYVAVPLYTLKIVKERTVSYPVDQLGHSAAVAQLMHTLLDDADRERVYVIALNGRMRIVGVNEAGSGGIAHCLLDPRNVLKFGLVSNASAILVSHNHPSGDPTPSAEDQDLTRALVASCKIVGLPLIDHVIVAPQGHHYSMHEHGDAGL